MCIATTILCFYYSFSQTYTEGVDAKLQLLDKSAITTHILYDRVYPGASLTQFNQTLADTSAVGHFYQAWGELQTADYLTRWTPVNALQTAVALQTEQQKIPIGILNVDFEHLDELAFQDHLVDVQGGDSLLTDVPARPRSPYLKKTALVVSPLAVHSNSTTVSFVTGTDFTLEAATHSITAIAVDIDNGQGWQPLPLTGELSLDFSGPGLYVIHFKLNLSNGDTRYTYATLKVYTAPPIQSKSEIQQKVAESDCFSGIIESSIMVQGYDEDKAYSGTGEYEVFLGGPELDHPVIVLDGFDPFEGQGDLGVNINGIYDFLNYNDFDNIGDDLRFSHGYDIIPLNFTRQRIPEPGVFLSKKINGGTDYIERNAMVLIDLITQVNSCKTGGHPIKVIGFSMGGLIARYALRYMELNGIPHDTDLFISIDTPHKGAVVPLGVQELADVIDNIAPFGTPDHADDLLHTPAAKQMLIHHYLAHSQTPQGTSFHTQFYADLETMGFPEQTRNIAVVNGTANGTPINTPGQQYVNAHGQAILLGLLGTKARTKLHYAPQRGTTKNVMKFVLRMRLALIDIIVYKRTRQVATPAATGSYENTPGGFFDVSGLTRNFFGDSGAFLYDKGTLTSLYLNANINLTHPDFSFIPVKSALAYTGAEADLYEDFSARNLVCSGETPLDSYYIPPENQQHISLTEESVAYITQEILGNPQEPNLNVVGDNIITGPSVVCHADTMFSLRDCSVNGAVWSVSPNLQIVNATPNSLTVRALTNSTKGFGSISATVGSEHAMEKQVYVGEPKAPVGNITGPTTVTPGMMVSYFGVPAEGATSYKWKLPYPYSEGLLDIHDPNWRLLSASGATSISAFTGTQGNTGLVQLMGENTCGCGGALTLQLQAPGGGPKTGGHDGAIPAPQGGFPKFLPADEEVSEPVAVASVRLYPNPADKMITLQRILPDRVTEAIPQKLYGLRIFDMGSREVARFATDGSGHSVITVAIGQLPSGYYTVVVATDKGYLTKKLTVK